METKNKKQEWIENDSPFINEPVDLEMFGHEVRIRRFKIYEDDNIKVTRVEDPKYSNDLNNYVQLFIKNGAVLINFPIGGYITREMAIYNAKFVSELYRKYQTTEHI